MSIIDVKDLRKEFKILKRNEGLRGAIKDLFSRKYTIINAVDGISFSLNKGEIVGFVGPNGAGKSTTIKMLTGVLEPTAGSVIVNGIIPFKNRKKNAENIGVVFGQRTQLWWDLPVIESFYVLKEIYKIPKDAYDKILGSFNKLVNLKELYAKPVRTLSLGQRMLCDIAASFLHNPKIIYLDEPTIGLDISVKSKIRTLIQELNKVQKTTIILTTHDISDIEALCKRIIIIDKGKIIYDGTIKKVNSLIGTFRLLKISFGQSGNRDIHNKLISYCKEHFPEDNSFTIKIQDDGWIHISINEEKLKLPDVLNAIVKNFPYEDIQVEKIEIAAVIKKIYEGALK